MKRILYASIIILLFTTCKKKANNESPGPIYSAVGTWAFYSYDDEIFSKKTYKSDEFPCLGNNVLTIAPNGTYNSTYTGPDICYISSAEGSSPGTPTIAIGVPNQTPITGSWHQTANDFYLGNDHAKLSSANGKILLTFKDSVIYNNQKKFEISVYIKQ